MEHEEEIMIDLTPTRRQTLQAWLSSHDREYAIELTRVLAREKPGIELRMSPLNNGPFLTAERAAAFVNDLGRATAQRGDKHYIAHSNDWLDRLPSESLPDSDHSRQMGVFFGYPEEDIDFFIRTHPDDRVSPTERVDNGDFAPKEMAHIDFLSYVPEDSIAGYERAIENGKHVRELLLEVADEWRLPVIEEIAEDHYQSAVDGYAGDRDPGFVEFKMITTNPNLD